MTDSNDNTAPASMPEGLPEQFWDTQSGSVKMPELMAAYGEAARFKADHDERIKALPQKPEDYKMEGALPQGFMVPHGFEPKVDPNDARIPALREFAHKHGLPQEAVSALIGLELQSQVTMQMAADAELQGEMQKLGENGKERVARVTAELSSHLTEAEYNAIRPHTGSAVMISALEKLLAMASAPPRPQSNGAGASAAERIWPTWR